MKADQTRLALVIETLVSGMALTDLQKEMIEGMCKANPAVREVLRWYGYKEALKVEA